MEKSPIQVIARAVAILKSLEDEKGGLSLGHISKRLELPRSTVQRIVAALAAEQLLIAASPQGRVRLGPLIARLAKNVTTDFTQAMRPFIETLSQDLKETVDLAAIRGNSLVFVDQVVFSHRLSAISAVGERFPLTCTANGKAYLACLDNDAVKDLVGDKFEALTPNTITTITALRRELGEIRKTGVALDLEEHHQNVCAAGIAFQDPHGNYMAISTPVPSQRFQKKRALIISRLRELREQLSTELGA